MNQAFADEMTKIANARMRFAEAGLGAVLGAGGGYLVTGRGEGAAVGGVGGAAAATAAARLGAHHQVKKLWKEFLTSKKVTDSAQQLVEGSPLLSRPQLIQQQLNALDTQDIYPRYFEALARRAGADPKVFDGIPALAAKEKSLLEQLQHARKTRLHHERVMNHAYKNYLPTPAGPRAVVGNLEEHEKGLRYQLRGIQNVLQGRQALQRDISRRARAAERAHKTSLRQALTAAKNAIEQQKKEHAELLQQSETELWKRINDKLFGVY